MEQLYWYVVRRGTSYVVTKLDMLESADEILSGPHYQRTAEAIRAIIEYSEPDETTSPEVAWRRYWALNSALSMLLDEDRVLAEALLRIREIMFLP